MTHYQVLGVAEGAPTEEIRRAYLALARRHHPDFHTGSDGSAVRAEEEMRRINRAWEVLGDPVDRAAYDRTLGVHRAVRPGSTGTAGPAIRRPSTEFTPLVPDDDDDDDWRYEPDEVDPSTVPPRVMLIAPPGLLALGMGLLVLSVPTGIRALVVVGVLCLAAAVLSFVATPMLAMFRGQAAEERAARRR